MPDLLRHGGRLRLRSSSPVEAVGRSRPPFARPSILEAHVEVNVDTQTACLAKISFTVPAEEFTSEFEKGLAQARQNTRMKGFRPGKAPRATLVKAYGQSIREEVKQHFLRLAFQRAVAEEGLDPLGNPRVTADDLKRIELGPDDDFRFEFETDLRPSFELEDHAGMEIESELSPVLPEEIEGAIEQFKRRQARPEAAGDDGLPADGMAICQVALVHEDDVVLEREGMRLNAETPLPGVDPEQWKQAITGQIEGAVVELPIELPAGEEIAKEAARGQQGTARVTLTQVFKLVQPSVEQLCKLLEVEDEAGFQEKVRTSLEDANREQEHNRIETELLSRVLDRYSFEVPDRMVEEQLQGRLGELRTSLEEQGLEGEAVEAQVEAGRDEARQAAERSVRAFFILEAIAQKEELKVTDEEMRAELMNIARRNEVDPQEVLQFYRENNQLNQLALELAERKVRARLREQATIHDPR